MSEVTVKDTACTYCNGTGRVGHHSACLLAIKGHASRMCPTSFRGDESGRPLCPTCGGIGHFNRTVTDSS